MDLRTDVIGGAKKKDVIGPLVSSSSMVECEKYQVNCEILA